jgi:hypothetical protein
MQRRELNRGKQNTGDSGFCWISDEFWFSVAVVESSRLHAELRTRRDERATVAARRGLQLSAPAHK